MRILIDYQYKDIYGGEFTQWVKSNIIDVFSISNIVDLPKNFEDCRKLLTINNYDLVIATGYQSDILAIIDDKKYDTKVACIIYDMNAEQMLSIVESNGYLEDIVAFKSRLIFLCNKVICHNSTVHNQILELYSAYKTINIQAKLLDIEYLYKINNEPIQRTNLLTGKKYILVKESINGLTFSSAAFHNFIDNIIHTEEIPSNFCIAIVSNNFPSKIWYKIKNNGYENIFKVLTDVSDEELRCLYNHSIASLFLSPLDNDLDNLCNAVSSNAICLINEENEVFKNFLEDAGNYFPVSEEYNFMDDIMEIMRAPKEIKDTIKEAQKTTMLSKISSKANRLNKILS